MSIKGYDKAKLRSVSGITKAQHDLIYAFLQGAVYVWCKLRPWAKAQAKIQRMLATSFGMEHRCTLYG